MKRLVLMMVAAIGLTASVFAAGNEPAAAKWEGNINVDKLSDYLDLSAEQYNKVSEISNFLDEQLSIANHATENQSKLLQMAIYDNLKLMKQTLTPKQFAKYTTVMDLTLNNRGIKIAK